MYVDFNTQLIFNQFESVEVSGVTLSRAAAGLQRRLLINRPPSEIDIRDDIIRFSEPIQALNFNNESTQFMLENSSFFRE